MHSADFDDLPTEPWNRPSWTAPPTRCGTDLVLYRRPPRPGSALRRWRLGYVLGELGVEALGDRIKIEDAITGRRRALARAALRDVPGDRIEEAKDRIERARKRREVCVPVRAPQSAQGAERQGEVAHV